MGPCGIVPGRAVYWFYLRTIRDRRRIFIDADFDGVL